MLSIQHAQLNEKLGQLVLTVQYVPQTQGPGALTDGPGVRAVKGSRCDQVWPSSGSSYNKNI